MPGSGFVQRAISWKRLPVSQNSGERLLLIFLSNLRLFRQAYAHQAGKIPGFHERFVRGNSLCALDIRALGHLWTSSSTR